LHDSNRGAESQPDFNPKELERFKNKKGWSIPFFCLIIKFVNNLKFMEINNKY